MTRTAIAMGGLVFCVLGTCNYTLAASKKGSEAKGGDVTLTGEWRSLAGIEALNGVLLMGWSTAIYFLVFQRLAKDFFVDDEPTSNE